MVQDTGEKGPPDTATIPFILLPNLRLLMVTLLGLQVQKPKIAYLTFPEVGYCVLLVYFNLENKTGIKPDKIPMLYE